MKLQTPQLTLADLTPPPLTRRRREEAERRREEARRKMTVQMERFITDAAGMMKAATVGYYQLAQALQHAAAPMRNISRLLRRHGHPHQVTVTVQTPTGTECRQIEQHLGCWQP